MSKRDAPASIQGGRHSEPYPVKNLAERLMADPSRRTTQDDIAPRRSHFARYFARRGWIHVLLLLAVWLFLFPFVWMVLTSFETDEEYIEGNLPAILHFRAQSPYVREVGEAIKPPDVLSARWREILPKLREIASAAIPGAIDDHHAAATTLLISRAAARMDRRFWTEDDAKLFAEFKSFLSGNLISAALEDSLGRLELLRFQLHTLDGRIFNLTDSTEFAQTWKIESGDGELHRDGAATVLGYHFMSANSSPVVLRYEFDLPKDTHPGDLQKVALSVRSDNSWHRVDATLDLAGARWASDESNYLSQFRPLGLIFQPPGFDDKTNRAKVWTTLRKVGAGETRSNHAVFRLTLAPSSTLRANFGKAILNFDRVFKSVPFWRYIGNSILLVVLCTIGSLFSASFVAYAFARLHWPGRSFAFVILLATMMLPSQVTMIPGFLIWRFLHWYNTLNPMWVPSFLGSAFFIFLMTQHMKTIPRELEEAARIDGLNAVQSWYYIILPNVKPSLAAIAILSFIGAWNEFMGPLIYLRDEARFPLSLGLYGLNLMHAVDGVLYPSPMIMAGNLLMTLPVIVVFFLFQRYFVAGMSMTGMKS